MRGTPTCTIALALALAAGSCYEDDTTGPVRGKPTTTVELTDAPFPYDSVERLDLYVVKIEASTSTDTSPPATTCATCGPWVTIAEPHRAYNLIELSGGITDTLGGADIPPGQYRAIRMILDTDSSSITAKNGQPMSVDWQSSAGRPVLYAYVENPINVTNFGAEIVIDFDAGRSFLCDGPCSSFVFSPVFRAVNRSTTGSVTGRVTAPPSCIEGPSCFGDTSSAQPSPITNTTMTVYRGDLAAFSGSWFVVATGKTDSLGDFNIAFLLPGTYILRADAPRGSPYTPGLRGNVVVSAGQETQNQGITLPVAPGSIVVTPYPAGFQVGDSIVLTASVQDQNGAPFPDPVVGWSVTDTTIAQVYPLPQQQALLRAKAEGSTQLLVSSQGASTAFTITVSTGPPTSRDSVASVTVQPLSATIARGDSLVLQAFARDGGGNILSGRPFTWTSGDTLVARIWLTGPNGSYVLIRGGVPGTATVRASSEGKTGSATVTVGQ